ncbi:hypothetical protein D3C86_1780720 [compost metagenome]
MYLAKDVLLVTISRIAPPAGVGMRLRPREPAWEDCDIDVLGTVLVVSVLRSINANEFAVFTVPCAFA